MSAAHAVLAALLGIMVGSSAVLSAELREERGTLGTVPSRQKIFLDEYGEAKSPSGFVNFCARMPGLCQPADRQSPRRIILSPERWALLRDVNTRINTAIRAETDQELYGQVEFWTLPKDAGDCEDYVLLKRETLKSMGFAESSLLITVVLDEQNEGHAVLTIPTTSGDLVLDNRRNQILPWADTGYTFMKRQSNSDPNRWVSLGVRKLQATNFASGPEAP